MEKSDLTTSLEAIIEKRRNCIPLTNAEEKLVNESLNKLLDAKKCVNKTVTSTTGDEIRKSAASPVLPKAPSTDKATEGVPAQNRGKEGGYDSKADVPERKEGATDNAAVVPPVKDAAITDKKEEAVPSEKTEGKPYGDKTKEEWADADEKKHKQENYEEDRVGRMTEHANYDDSIKTQDIVVKTLSNGSKVVGHVLKVYQTKSGQVGLMVKWSDGRFEHVNQANVELLKAVKSFKEDLATGARSAADMVGTAGAVGAPDKVISTVVEATKKPTEKTEKGVLGSILTEAAALAGGITAADVGSHMIIDAMDAKNKKPKQPKIPKPEGSGTEAAGNIVTNKSADASVTEKSVANATLGVMAGSAVAGLPGAAVGGVIGALTGNKKKKDDSTEKVTGAITSEEVKPVAEMQTPETSQTLPEEAPEDFVRGVIDTLKELTDLSEEEITNVAKSAWKEIVAENVSKGANSKDLVAGEVRTTTDISTTAGPGRATSSNVIPKVAGKEDNIEKKPETK